MINPDHLTEMEIRGRIGYHEAGAVYYAGHIVTADLAAWSQAQAEYWRGKLPPEARAPIAPGAALQSTDATVPNKKGEPG